MIVVPDAAMIPARLVVLTPDTPEAPRPVILAAVVAAVCAAAATPPPPELDVFVEGTEILGIEGTEIELLELETEGMLTEGALSNATSGCLKLTLLYAEIRRLIP